MRTSSDSPTELLEEQEQESTEPALKAKDRCDSCNAQAYFIVVFGNGSLYFCNHHYNKYYPDLYESKLVLDVVDDSKKLYKSN